MRLRRAGGHDEVAVRRDSVYLDVAREQCDRRRIVVTSRTPRHPRTHRCDEAPQPAVQASRQARVEEPSHRCGASASDTDAVRHSDAMDEPHGGRDAHRREDPEEKHRSHGHEAIERGRSRGLGLVTGPRANGCGGEPRPARCRNGPPTQSASASSQRAMQPISSTGRRRGRFGSGLAGGASGMPNLPSVGSASSGARARYPVLHLGEGGLGRSTMTVPASLQPLDVSFAFEPQRRPADRTSAASRLCVRGEGHLRRSGSRTSGSVVIPHGALDDEPGSFGGRARARGHVTPSCGAQGQPLPGGCATAQWHRGLDRLDALGGRADGADRCSEIRRRRGRRWRRKLVLVQRRLP